METSQKFPLWAWWIVGIAVIVSIAVGAIYLTRSKTPVLPPGLAEKRQTVSDIFTEANAVKDVDIKPLVEFENKKDYKAAVELMDRAVSANQQFEDLSARLVTVSDELTKLAVRVEPETVGTKAIEAFGILAQLAQSEKDFYVNRRKLYEITKTYYADLASKKNPAIPGDLQTLVETVNASLAKVQTLHAQFATAVQTFDAIAR